MKPKPLVVSAIAVSVLVAGLGFHIATRPADEIGKTASSPSRSSRTPRLPANPDAIFGDGNGCGQNARATVARTSCPQPEPRFISNSRTDPQDENRLGIPAIDLLAAQEIADELAANLERQLTMPDAGYRQPSHAAGNPAETLGLRLGVDPSIAETLGEIFAGDHAKEVELQIAAERSRIGHTRDLLENDRDRYVVYLALDSMLSRGIPLSEEQKEFHKQFPQTSDSTPAKPEWYEKPELLDALRRHLSAEQRTELAKFVDEQKAREQERQTMRAYMRSGTIADRLGLDDTDRNALYEHLRGNPDASGPELSEVLAPELRKLLPPGL